MTENKRPIYSDLKKLDAHVVQPHECEEAPELSDAELAKAIVSHGPRPTVPTRAKKSTVKRASIRVTRKAGVKRRQARRAKA